MINNIKKCLLFSYYFPQRVKSILIARSKVLILDDNRSFFLLKLISLYFLVSLEKIEEDIGSLWSRASWSSVFASLIGNRFNINNLGNTYSIKDTDLTISQEIERKVIEWSKKTISCEDKNIEGYISSGGTESNLFLMWMGREYLKEVNLSKPLLLSTNFTHYSISKASRILDIDSHIIKIDKKNWSISLEDLEKMFLFFIKKSRFSFLLPITIGYSSTGASDSIIGITKLVKKLKKKYSKFKCFIWIDAAAQGLPKSFLDKRFKPLEDSLIQGYVVDFHKYANTPISSGIVLYRKKLKKMIEVPIPYLLESDATILGSRSGSSAFAIWANIVSNDTEKWKKKFLNLEKRKLELIKKLKEKNPSANILFFKNSLTFAVELNSNFEKFPSEFGNPNSFIKCNINGFIHYKFHIQ